MNRERMDAYGLAEARLSATMSKDPSTQVGAAVLRPDGTLASKGWNGFPRGVADTPDRLNDRAVKYEIVVHAELNALLTAREPLAGCTIYTTLHPCSRCAACIIQAGIRRVVTVASDNPRFADSFKLAADLFAEAGVALDIY